ncbi:MAG: glycoside hydrolase family 2, partial [Verrucomicrobia bacterium]
VQTRRTDSEVEIIARRHEDGARFTWTLSAAGVTLDYRYGEIAEPLTYCAVGFDLSDAAVLAKVWRGRGPHRVWANRMQGPQFGRWSDVWNDNVVGRHWDAPPFKGVFADVDWMRLDLAAGAALLFDPEGAAHIGVLRPRNAEGPRDKNTFAGPVRAWWAYPEAGGLYLFHKIPAIGTKFANAERLGPQSVPVRIKGPIAGRVTFHVRALDER